MPEPFDLARLGEEVPPELHRLLERCPDIEALRFREGEYLMREGEAEQHLFVVLRGAFAVESASAEAGPAGILDTVLCDGQVAIVGEMAVLGAERRTASVRSSGATHTLRIQGRHLDVILEDFPFLTRVICQQFTRRLQEANVALQDLRGRFALGAERRMVPAGERLFSRGEAPERLFQLALGAVRLEGEGGARVVVPEDLPLGFLEHEAFLRQRPYAVTAAAETDSFVLCVPASRREALLRCHPALALKLLEGGR